MKTILETLQPWIPFGFAIFLGRLAIREIRELCTAVAQLQAGAKVGDIAA